MLEHHDSLITRAAGVATRPILAATLRVLRIIVAGVFVVIVVGGIGLLEVTSKDVDRSSYTRANLKLLHDISAFPGASLVRLESRPWKLSREPLPWSYIAGYRTTATYDAPPGTTADGVKRFLRRRLTGWTLASRNNVKQQVDYRCYERSGEAVCINLLGFLSHGKVITGGRFAISVDYRGYEPRTNP